MLVFLDESLRTNKRTGVPFGVLSGVAIPEETYHTFQRDFYQLGRPYHGKAISEDGEIHGSHLLNNMTFKILEKEGYCYRWNLCQEAMHFARSRKIKVFGVVCFRHGMTSFICGDDHKLDATFRYLFERIDLFMKREFPGKFAKLVFDNRDHQTHEKNARAITNFFMRSTIGLGYDSIIRIPMFAVSQGHNYGLQLADLVTTIIGLKFQGERRIKPLWNLVHQMLAMQEVGGMTQSSLKIIRQKLEADGAIKKGSAAVKPIAEPGRPAPNLKL